MTSDEIQTFFQASATLRKCPESDPRRENLKHIVDTLKKQYIAEYFQGRPEIASEKTMSIEEAFQTLVNACNSATQLELQHKPNGMSEDDVKSIALTRQVAINHLVEELAKR
jgi:hypothetical protein